MTQGAPQEHDAAAGPAFDPSVPSPARVWNFWVGGKDHFEADRALAGRFGEVVPGMPLIARLTRLFLADTVTQLAAAGIRQFLDIGTGLPTADNTHEVAQRLAPDARIVYADNDPVVLAHARALLTSSPEGVTDYLDADVRDVDHILEQAAETLDFTQPVAVILLAILHYIPDLEESRQVVARLTDAIPSGSFVVISHAASDIDADRMAEMIRRMNEHMGGTTHVGRTREVTADFFTGLDLVEPGVVKVTEWRPESEQAAKGPTSLWGGVARKP